jgi:acetyl esterase/lipase
MDEGENDMSKQQLAAIDQEIRLRPSLAGLDLAGQRAAFERLLAENEGLPDLPTEAGELGGVPVLRIGDGDDVVFFLHGGAYVVGSAAGSVKLAGAIGARAGARVISVDYRLAPEHPFPAGLDDALAAYRALLDSGVPSTRIAFAGDSAGGGLALATLLAARDAGLPLPSSAVLLSPWTDLTLSGASMTEREALDAVLSPAGLAAMADTYRGQTDAKNPLVSPVLADLRGLPPLLIEVGSHEILLDDSLRLAARAAADEVQVRLEVTPGASHVFPVFGNRLDEAIAALRHIGEFVSDRFPAAVSD